MLRTLTGFILIASAFGFLYFKSPLEFYLKPKQERLYLLWSKDFRQLSKDQNFAKIFSQLGQVDVHFTDPQVATEFEDFKTPFMAVEGYPYTLKIGITRWIEKTKYGFVVQHELLDPTGDKIYEFGRTYSVGFIL